MKELNFQYEMKLRFDHPVSKHHFTLHCLPQSSRRQRIQDLAFEVSPYDSISQSHDSFGNRYVYGCCLREHTGFDLRVSGSAAAGLVIHEEDPYCPPFYKYPSSYTRPGEGIAAYDRRLKARYSGAPGLDYALFMMRAIHEDLVYSPGSTGVGTTAEAALKLGKGVCQDFTHILISLCRLNSIPARYVVGMLTGEGLSHAWAEVYTDGFWTGLDPTNNTIVSDQHIKISNGRDYNDCRINLGVFSGYAKQTQQVSVIVKEETL